MNETKYQIFISSTYKDLIDAREAVQKTILGLYQFPIGMEMFSADDNEQWEVIQETIDSSDYYVLIIGHRYGSEASDGISYTEKEFDYAKGNGIPVLSFIRNRNSPTTPEQREDQQKKAKKLDAFIAKASGSKMCDFWETEEQLASKVAIALSKIFRKTPRVGWVRSDKAISPQVSEELARLSRENRDLNQELEGYRNKQNNRQPEISVSLSATGPEPIVFKDLPLKVLSLKQIDSIPSHLSDYVTQIEIDEFNRSLPDKKEIEQFNTELNHYLRLTEGAIDCQISISNIGSLSANEVIVDLEFPEDLIVFEEYDWKELEEPKIDIPKNPISAAEKEYLKDQKRRSSSFSMFNDLSGIQSYSNHLFTSPITDLPSAINRDSWVDIKDNQVSIRLKKLIHTRQRHFDEIKVIPLREGSFEIKYSIICEELESPKMETLNIEIKKGQPDG